MPGEPICAAFASSQREATHDLAGHLRRSERRQAGVTAMTMGCGGIAGTPRMCAGGWVGKCSLPSMIPSSEHRGLVRAEERSGARVLGWSEHVHSRVGRRAQHSGCVTTSGGFADRSSACTFSQWFSQSLSRFAFAHSRTRTRTRTLTLTLTRAADRIFRETRCVA